MSPDTVRLIEGYIEHTLTESELRELLNLVDSDPEVGLELANASQLQGLVAVAGAARVEDQVMDRLDGRPVRRRKVLYWALAIAAQIAIISGAWFMRAAPEQKPVHMAHVVYCQGGGFLVRNDQKLMLKKGLELFSEDQVFMKTASTACLEYHDGSQLHLKDYAFLKLLSEKGAKHIQLYSGMLQGDIQPQRADQPMLVKTSDSCSTVLGTRFEINTSGRATLLEVSEGAVGIEQHDSGAVVKVGPEEFAVSRSGGGLDHKKRATPVFRSELITKKTEGLGVDIHVDLNGAQKIYLVASNGGDNNRFDHVAWLNPMFTGSRVVDLTQREWFLEKTGWKSTVINGGLVGNPLQSGGRVFKKGISSHATSVIAYEVPSGVETFTARGVLLDSGVTQEHSVASVRFEVYTDPPESIIEKLLIRGEFY